MQDNLILGLGRSKQRGCLKKKKSYSSPSFFLLPAVLSEVRSALSKMGSLKPLGPKPLRGARVRKITGFWVNYSIKKMPKPIWEFEKLLAANFRLGEGEKKKISLYLSGRCIEYSALWKHSQPQGDVNNLTLHGHVYTSRWLCSHYCALVSCLYKQVLSNSAITCITAQ